MKNISKEYANVIAKAAKEAGIADSEKCKVTVISIGNSLCELEFETEWNRITCYADLTTGEIPGILAEAKTMDEILWGPDFRSAAAAAMLVNAFRAA